MAAEAHVFWLHVSIRACLYTSGEDLALRMQVMVQRSWEGSVTGSKPSWEGICIDSHASMHVQLEPHGRGERVASHRRVASAMAVAGPGLPEGSRPSAAHKREMYEASQRMCTLSPR